MRRATIGLAVVALVLMAPVRPAPATAGRPGAGLAPARIEGGAQEPPGGPKVHAPSAPPAPSVPPAPPASPALRGEVPEPPPGLQGSTPIPVGSGYPPLTAGQSDRVRRLLAGFREDPRGPYLRIRWFCNDGSILPPEPGACSARGGGHQHAELKPEAVELGELGFHVGTILRAIDFEEFVDFSHGGYRLRELPVQHYLEAVDDGWVLERARFYRGASQAEDEERRGREFLVRLLENRRWSRDNPYLATALVAAVPHGQPGTSTSRVRSLAEQIAAADPGFQRLRIKIHSRPGPGDLEGVRAYLQALPPDADPGVRGWLDELVHELAVLYTDADLDRRLAAFAERLAGLPLAVRLAGLPAALRPAGPRGRLRQLSSVVRDARRALDEGDLGGDPGATALGLLDLIVYLSDQVNRAANTWVAARLAAVGPPAAGEPGAPGTEPPSRAELLEAALDLLDATYGVGLLYEREYEALRGPTEAMLSADQEPAADPLAGLGAGTMPAVRMVAATYYERVRYLGHAPDWAQATAEQVFGMVLERYRQVEPVTRRFVDDQLRSSPLLAYAAIVDTLSRDAGLAIGLLHSIFDTEVHAGVVGLNPGVAVGRLHVVDDVAELQDLDPDGIYVLPETPADLGRVAGILTLQEGSRLSHVQLLARSLGLPNAVVDAFLLPELRSRSGQQVFYAVSPMGSVVLKPMEELTAAELRLLEEEATAPEGTFAIDLDELDLGVRELLPLADLDLEDSGRIVGPKAANLGHLHRLFPGRVPPGLAIPFGVFRAHIDRDLMGTGRTLYEDLVGIYGEAGRALEAGADPGVVRRWIAGKLEGVQGAIAGMDLLPGFEATLRRTLEETFGPEGTYGVFVRSDTNVEDLPSFTGAGLNLTVMNQIDVEDILDAIKRVWASPFSERSYTWRQRLLTTPEAVYPSVVLLQSVPADVSGVVATTDLSGGEPGMWTVTLSEGIGGVVEGEPAETTLVPARQGRPELLSSARAVWQKVLRMSGSGGIERIPARGTTMLLTDARLTALRRVVGEILERYPPVAGEDGRPMPWDIELGFVGDDVRLFQIRPLVSNRRAAMLRALVALDAAALEEGGRELSLADPPRTERERE